MQETIFVKPDWHPNCRKIELSTWDQTFPCLYTPRFYCFPSQPSAEYHKISWSLQQALARALVEWPDLSGTVVDEDKDRGTCALVIEEGAGVEWKKCDYRSSSDAATDPWRPWTFYELEAKGFPPAMLGEAPLANFNRQIQLRPTAVFKTQLSLIHGGAILAMGFLHRVVDGETMKGFMRSWSWHCRAFSEGIEAQPSLTSPFDRSLMSNSLPGGDISDFPTFRLADSFSWGSTSSSMKVVCPVWRICRSEQEALKTAASATSTNDAICCRLWLSVSKARKIVDSGFDSSNLSVGMNLRPYLNPPLENYFGNATYRIGVTVGIQQLQSLDLVSAAKKFRQSLNDFRSDDFRKLLGLIDKLPSIKALQPSYRLHGGPDLFLTTHAHFGEFDNDWGSGLGIPRAIRVLPVPSEGFGVIFPMYPNGSLEMMTSLSDEVFGRLRQDKEFAKYFSLVCE